MLGKSWSRERRRRGDAVTHLEEEVTAFGETLAAHTFAPGRPDVTAEAAADYKRALDAYEQAKHKLKTGRGRLSLRGHRDDQGALRALDEGRHALACLDARLSGEPLPKRLPLCFFDPRHGPSVSELPWTPEGGGQRLIAVCAADAVRLADGVGPIASGQAQDAVRLAPASVSAGSGSALRQPLGSVAAEPLSNAQEPGRKPRLRDRYTSTQLTTRGLFALLAVYMAALLMVGEHVAALLMVTVGGSLGGLAFGAGSVTGWCLLMLWRIIRRGRRVRADFVRRQTTGETHEHVFAVTDDSVAQFPAGVSAGE